MTWDLDPGSGARDKTHYGFSLVSSGTELWNQEVLHLWSKEILAVNSEEV